MAIKIKKPTTKDVDAALEDFLKESTATEHLSASGSIGGEKDSKAAEDLFGPINQDMSGKTLPDLVPAPPQFQGHETSGKVEKNIAGVQSSDSIPVASGVQSVATPTANVGLTVALTKNLGNYESCKFSVSLHMPCLPIEEDIEDTFAAVKAWVDAKTTEILNEINGE